MPSFVEEASRSAQEAPLIYKYPPLPRLILGADAPNGEFYEVVIVGAGPAGAFLNLLLARYGVKSRLCVDATSEAVKTGHADGIVTRTLEILQSMGICETILRYAGHLYGAQNWEPDPEKPEAGIRRSPQKGFPTKWAPSRWDGAVSRTMHQGWVLKILNDDLKKYSDRGIERGTTVNNVKIDDVTDKDFPVVVELTAGDGASRQVRAKYVVGADGAHSIVRKSLGIRMEGSATDDIFGVIDLVADTNFPDIRKWSHINDGKGTILNVPREQLTDGQWLTRLYVPFADDVVSPEAKDVSVEKGQDASILMSNAQARKAGVTKEKILEIATGMFKPYRLAVKEGTEVEWWTAYQVGRRLAERVVEKDSSGHQRVFIIGDAAHTHSPKEGQGMNVSMADAFDLSWKLTYVLFGLTPDPQALLATHVHDRRQNAENLLDLDKRWYESKYANRNGIKPDDGVIGQEMFSFVCGLTVEYDEGFLVDAKASGPKDAGIITSGNNMMGALKEGMRLADALMMRLADEAPLHMQDEVTIDGKYRIIAFLSPNQNPSWHTAETILDEIVPRHPAGVVKPLFIIDKDFHTVDWDVLPSIVHDKAEMDVFCATKEMEDMYAIDMEKGALVVIRPDQVVGSIARLEDTEKIKTYLDRVLTTV